MPTIFQSNSYTDYLREKFGGIGKRTGKQQAAAKAIGCHTTYLSQVLRKRALLGLEQAEKLNDFLNHNEEEAHFFLLLVQRERAGTNSLQRYFQKQIDQIIRDRSEIKKRTKISKTIDQKLTSEFYSHWHYAVIHILLTIPSLQTPESIQSYLNLPISEIRRSLEFLTKIGLAELRGDKYICGPEFVHLDKKSPDFTHYHTNWRLHAINKVSQSKQNGIHYSAAISLSEADAENIFEILSDSIERSIGLVKNSQEEVSRGLCIDYYDLNANS